MSTISNLPNRQSIRLSNYDYSQKGSYFLTLVTQDRLHLFGKIEEGKMILNSVGKIVEEEWKKTLELRSNITLGEFIIMPDHMHMIITIHSQIKSITTEEWIYSNPKSPSHTIGAIIRGFKGASTKKINLFLNSTGELPFATTTEFYKNKIFQRNYYEHIIRNQQDFNRIEKYILDNPKNWKKKKMKSKMNEIT